MYACMYVCMYVCKYVCMYVCWPLKIDFICYNYKSLSVHLLQLPRVYNSILSWFTNYLMM